MSERSSFVTEYLYCDECFEKLKGALVREEGSLTGRVIDPYPIIAGRISSTGPGEEISILMDAFNRDNAPCHHVRLTILCDYGDSYACIILSSGRVDVLGYIGREELEDYR